MLRSFKHRNFRLYFFGQFVSVTGTWLQITAMSWLVYRLTNSALLLGLMGFLSQIFILLFSPLAGTAADHYDRKKLLMFMQILAMLQALTLAALTLSGKVQIWHIMILAPLAGMINAFDMPARQSFIADMVGKKDLMNAVGLSAMIFNAAKMIGPAIAGILIAAFGEGICFLVNGLSFMSIIVAIYFIIPLSKTSSGEESSIHQKFFSGIDYLRRSEYLASLMFLMSVSGLAGIFPMILMPIFVKDVYGLDASGLGIFMSAMGIGSLLGTISIARKQSTGNISETILISAAGFGIFSILFSILINIYAAVFLLALMGYSLVLLIGLTTTLVQINTPDEMRGRVMGYFIMAFMGFAPLGSLFAGILAHKINVQVTMAIGGALLLTAAVVMRKNIFVDQKTD